MGMGHRRRVLLVSYWYPPTPGAGAARTSGFARNLPSLGWDTVVLTAGNRRDDDLSPVAGESRLIALPDAVAPSDLYRDYSGPPRESAAREWWRWLLFPDRFLRWRRRARRAGDALLRRERCDAVWATFPPASAALVGARLAQRRALPLVLDVRDPWLSAGGYEPRGAALRRRHERLERELLARADAVVTVSDALADDLRGRLRLDVSRVSVIPNGWDDSLSAPLPPGAVPPQNILTCVGTVSHRNRPDLFLSALARKPPDAPPPWRVQFVGNLSPGFVRRLGLSAVVESTGLVSSAEAWQRTCAAPALLLLVGDYVGRWGHNVKVFDYLRSARPILCLEQRPGSNDRALLERLAPKRCVFGALAEDSDVVPLIARVLELARAAPRLALDESAALARFGRRALSIELAGLLDRVAGR